MANERRSYSRGVKAEAVRRVVEAGEAPATVARELDVNASALRAWVHEWRRNYRDPEHRSPAEVASTEALLARIRDLETENEFLKKAQAFFATSAPPNAAR